jgi:hypothetical protein
MLRKLMWIAIFGLIGATIYSGYNLAIPHYQYYRLKSRAEFILSFVATSDQELREKLSREATGLGLNVPPEKFEIIKTDRGEYTAHAAWSNTVSLFGGRYKKKFTFALEVKP